MVPLVYQSTKCLTHPTTAQSALAGDLEQTHKRSPKATGNSQLLTLQVLGKLMKNDAEPKLRPHKICTFCMKNILIGTALPEILAY